MLLLGSSMALTSRAVSVTATEGSLKGRLSFLFANDSETFTSLLFLLFSDSILTSCHASFPTRSLFERGEISEPTIRTGYSEDPMARSLASPAGVSNMSVTASVVSVLATGNIDAVELLGASTGLGVNTAALGSSLAPVASFFSS